MPALKDQLTKTFLEQNPEVDFLHFDFNREGAIIKLDFTGLDRPATIDSLKALQRLLRLCPSQSAAYALYDAGFRSAHQIASIPEAKFARAWSGSASQDVDPETARVIHRRAASAVEHIRLHAMSLAVLANPALATMPANNAGGLLEFYNGLPGYQELFGSLNYVQCEECQSLWSPAAYFVDLLRLVDAYITKPENEQLSLAARRPDLWEIPLTCASTNQEVPYLQVVNQILEAQVKSRLREPLFTGLQPSGARSVLSFDGSTTSIDLAVNPFRVPNFVVAPITYAPPSRFTVGAWVSPAILNPANSVMGIMGSEDSEDASKTIPSLCMKNTGDLVALLQAESPTSVPFAHTADGFFTGANTWVHLAWVFDLKTRQSVIYRNGIQFGAPVSTGAITSISSPPGAWKIGNAGGGYWQGLIANVGVWLTALEPREIALAMKAEGLPPSRSNLASYWLIDDQSTAIANSAPYAVANPALKLAGALDGAANWKTLRASDSSTFLSRNPVLSEQPLLYLATQDYPFKLPFNHPLVQIRGLLAHFDVTLAEVYTALLVENEQGEKPGIAREVLELSPEKYNVVTGAITDDDALQQAYGLIAAGSSLSHLNDAAVFSEQTGLSDQQLDELLFQNLRRKRALEFNGSFEVAIDNPPTLQALTGDLTVELWLRPADFTTHRSALCKAYGGEFAVSQQAGSAPTLYLCYGVTGKSADKGSAANLYHCYDTPAGALTLYQWSHMAFVRDLSSTQKTVTVYVNGKASAPYTKTFPAAVAGTAPVTIGSGYLEPYIGQIADVRLWNVVRSADEIKTAMNQRLQGDEPGLAGCWPLDDGNGTTARDISPNENYGALQGVAGGVSGSLTDPPQWPFADNLVWDDNEINSEILGQFYINQGLSSGQYLALKTSKANNTVTRTIVVADPAKGTTTPLTDTGTFDRLNRFIRLAGALEWSFADLDLALRSIAPPPHTAIDEQAIEGLASLQAMQAKLKLPVDALCALWTDMNTIGIGNGTAAADLFDRTFNYPTSFADATGAAGTPPYRPQYSANPLYNDPPLAWSPQDRVSSSDQATRNRLRGALGVADDEITQICNFVLEDLGEINSKISLTVDNLSRLYRYVTLARALNLPVVQLLQLLHLLDIKELDNIKKVVAIVDWAEWMHATGLNVAQLDYLTTGKPNLWINTGYDPNAVGSMIESMFQESQSLLLTPNSFAASALSREDAEQIFQQLRTDGALDENGVVLKQPQALGSEPLSHGLPESDEVDLFVRETLIAGQVRQDLYVTQKLAAFFNVSPGLMAAAQALALVSHGKPLLHINRLLIDLDASDPVPDHVSELFAALALDLYLAAVLKLTSTDLAGLALQPAAFDLPAFGASFKWTIENLRVISEYTKLAAAFKDTNGQLIRYFNLTANSGIAPAAQGELATMTGWPADQIALLESQSFWPSGWLFNQVEQIAALKRCFDLAASLGAGIELLLSLRQLSAFELGVPRTAPSLDTWESYQEVAHALGQAIAARYGSSVAPQVLSKIEGQLEQLKRDMLAAFLLWELSFTYDDIKTSDDLYDFLLIDVDMSSVVEISPLKAGLNSLQLYVETTQLSLAAEVTNQIPRLWWSWMSNYRVWQANREVFLYPENYIDPALRRFPTPQFKQLESALQQGSLTPQLLESALTGYLEGFSGVANLEIVASYRAAVTTPESVTGGQPGVDTLFLFGRTRTNPPTFYLRALRMFDGAQVEQGVWTSWQQINLSINAASITPVYIFEKLFIFWVEQSSKNINFTNSSGAQVSYQITTATIYFSFQKLDRSWTPPQTLEQNLPISVRPPASDPNYYPPVDAESPAWQQVRAIANEASGQIIILYGDLVLSIPTPVDKPTVVGNPEIDAYNEMVYESLSFALLIEALGYANSFVPLWTLGSALGKDRANLEINLTARNFCAGLLAPEHRLVYGQVSGAPPATISQDISTSKLKNFLPLDGDATDLVTGMKAESGGVWTTDPTCPLGADRSVLNFPGGSESATESFPRFGGSLSAEIWVKFIKGEKILKLSETGGAPGYQLWVEGSKIWAGTGQTSTGASGDLQTGWMCLAFVVSAGVAPYSISIYVNGHLQGERWGVEISTIDGLTIGPFNGMAANVALWNRALSAGEILLRYQEHLNASYPLLTTGISASAARVEQTHNQPGWFTFDNGDEAFLVTPLIPGEPDNPAVFTSLAQTTSIVESPALGKALGVKRRTLKITFGDAAVDPGTFNFDDLKLKFTRLTTSTVAELERQFLIGGPDRLLSLASQLSPELPFARFAPTAPAISPMMEMVDFNGAYGEYFWELFFYTPFLIGNTLGANQRFQLAQKWFQYIFDPTPAQEDWKAEYKAKMRELRLVSDWPLNGNANDRFWRFRPFLNLGPDSVKANLTNAQQIAVYNNDPFDPDALARLRPGANERGIVMRYVENLIKWGNQLFAQYTWETITEASVLYTEALDLLGPVPRQVGEAPKLPVKTALDFVSEHGRAGAIPQFLIELEHDLKYLPPDGGQNLPALPFNLLDSYFCVPVNKLLLALWKEVDSQLYKIRHGENIKGQPQPLPLFQPPLNPAALIRSAAGGPAASSRTPSGSPTIPFYRFSYLISQAKDVTSQVIQLGSNLLGALERQDAEQLALMQNSDEAAILNLTTQIKQNQIDGLEQTAQSLQAALAGARQRQQTYGAWLRGTSGSAGGPQNSGDTAWTASLSTAEHLSLGLLAEATEMHGSAALMRVMAAPLFLLPDIFGLADGGMNFGGSTDAVAGSLDSVGGALSIASQLSGMVSQFQRRDQEWLLQYQLAGDDVAQIQAEIESNQTALASAQRDLHINQEQITQNQAIANFYRTKFTSSQLYQWMAGRLSTLYFQSYQLAFDLAQEAQAAFQYEKNNLKNYLSYGAWDSLKKGLTAGDSLMFSLNQLEKANIDAGIRHLEIEKTISLLQIDPQAVLDLKQTGRCSFALTERLFDYDFPGQYNRKIVSVSITIPAIVGPYQNVHATLTQTSSRVVLQPDIAAVKYLLPGGDGSSGPPPSIRSNWNVNQQVALSRGSNDSGLFELNFNDPRYLPFEGTGAISSWTLEMPQAANPIDFNSISDVIVQLRYTAQEGSEAFYKSVVGHAAISTFSGVRFLSLRQTFPEAWHSFLGSLATAAEIKFPILRSMFPLNLTPNTVVLGAAQEVNKLAVGSIGAQLLLADGATLMLDSLNGQKVNGGSVVLVAPGSPEAANADCAKPPVSLSCFGASVMNVLTASGAEPKNEAAIIDIVLMIPFSGQLKWPQAGDPER